MLILQNVSQGAIVGHVGDGNFHVTFPSDPNDTDEMQRIYEVNDRMIKLPS